jgi:hypothetical protein
LLIICPDALLGSSAKLLLPQLTPSTLHQACTETVLLVHTVLKKTTLDPLSTLLSVLTVLSLTKRELSLTPTAWTVLLAGFAKELDLPLPQVSATSDSCAPKTLLSLAQPQATFALWVLTDPCNALVVTTSFRLPRLYASSALLASIAWLDKLLHVKKATTVLDGPSHFKLVI